MRKQFAKIALDFKYKFFNGNVYREKYTAAESTWQKHQFASVHDGKVIGYIKYCIDREDDYAWGFQIVNFTKYKYVFGKDVIQAVDEVFTKFNFRKLKCGVYIGNPIESTYDKLMQKYGGRIIGIAKQDSKLIDGRYYDYKTYELFREDYFKYKK